MTEIEEIVGELLVDSYENLDRFDEDLVSLEHVELEMIGQDTELDKTIIEAIKDPIPSGP